MLDGPDDAVEDELELVRAKAEQRGEAVCVDGLKQCEEEGAVLGKLFQILVDHLQRALEHGVEDAGQSWKYAILQSVDNRRHEVEHLWLAH